VESVFESNAQQSNCNIRIASELYQVNKVAPGTYEVACKDQYETYALDLLGSYQAKNIKGVLAVVDELQKEGFRISNHHIKLGLSSTTLLTGLKGRWQKIGDNPLTICDTGHNEAGIKEILGQINEMKFNKLHWVFGVVKDKDISAILQLLPKDATYYFCQASIPRAMPANELKEQALLVGISGQVINRVNEAIAQARMNSLSNDLILVGGSTFVVAEIENL